jgi:flagellar hook-associated protein 3 FlgL
MNRVSTSGNYSTILANLVSAQQRQADAGKQLSTQKNGTNLKEYARSAEMLSAMNTIDARITTHLEQNNITSAKLETQDFALSQVSDAAGKVRQAIADALATDRSDTLMQDLSAQFANVVSGLNSTYGGKYLFAGGQVETAPVSANKLSDLTALGSVISDFFHNDTFVTQAKVDDSTTVTTGALADQMATGMMTAFKTLQAFHELTPFGGRLTSAQKTFLEGQLSGWVTIHGDAVNETAKNGMVQARVEGVKADLDSRHISIAGMIGDIADADMAQAATNLTQAQQAVQAASQVFINLKETSLLNYLR